MTSLELSPELRDRLKAWSEKAQRYTSDSRTLQAGDIFVAIRGSQSDGHQFVEAALKQGIVGAVVNQGFLKENPHLDSSSILEVSNTHLAHRELARLHREKFQGVLIAVGGSSGKTTTKDFIYEILTLSKRAMKTEKSQNGELGIPKTLERLEPNLEVAVIEVGIDAPGDMERHLAIVQPDIALLTSIGEEHLNRLKSIENVFFEERKLFDATRARGGRCFAPATDPWLEKLSGTAGVAMTPGDLDPQFSCELTHPLARQNAALAVAVARHIGLSDPQIQQGLDRLKLPEGRGRIVEISAEQSVIADHYNSNPSSLRAGLIFAVQTARLMKRKLHLILGDMLDLGSETSRAHLDVGNDIIATQAASITLIGPEMTKLKDRFESAGIPTHVFADSKLAALDAKRLLSLRPGLLLLKGSRGMALEVVLESLQRAK